MNPEAELIAHPECREEVLRLASFVGSTQALLDHTVASGATHSLLPQSRAFSMRCSAVLPEKHLFLHPATPGQGEASAHR